MEQLSAAEFNLLEGSFWLLLSLISLILTKKVPPRYLNLCFYTLFVLVAFGVSDFVEAYYGSFLVPGMEWLLVWKTINVICLATVPVWYLILRIKL